MSDEEARRLRGIHELAVVAGLSASLYSMDTMHPFITYGRFHIVALYM